MKYKIVNFARDSDRYYDYRDRELHKKENGAVIEEKNFNRYERDLLELLVDNAGRTITRNDIIDHIKGEDFHPEANSVNNHIGNLREAIDKKLNAKIIETVWGQGYRYIGTPFSDVEEPVEGSCPYSLTKLPGKYANHHTVIHRKKELADIEELLQEGVRAILLCGVGGMGKTLLAQLLCARVACNYDRVGWIEYHGTLKESMLAALELNQDISDQDKRWQVIENRLKNDTSEKILFIDNVDVDAKQGQDPLKDTLLKDIANWPYMTIVITSRIQDIPYYNGYIVGSLGDESDSEPCLDLFYFYYKNGVERRKKSSERQEPEAVRELVKLAGYHTYAIELLAKSAAYETTLSAYLDKIRESGFQFPTLAVLTNYYDGSAIAAKQLRKLFNLYSRSENEQHILWDFSVLPEGTALTRDETEELFLYTQNDLHRLCQESWLRHGSGRGFYVHPLVREVIHFDLHKGKAPRGTVSHVIELVKTKMFIFDKTAQSDVVRKLNMIEGIAKYIEFANVQEEADFYKRLGYLEYTFARKRLTSIDYLEYSLQLYQSLNETNEKSFLNEIAGVKYQLGYLKSTTQKYRDVAKNDLQDALDIWQSLDGHENEIAMARDHLGYVLSDSPDTYEDAKSHLTKALDMRKNFFDRDNSVENQRAYATTADNLGFLLSKSGWDFDKAKELLLEALQIREQVYLETRQHATDVAWTAFNLGKHLGQFSQFSKDAERYFNRSLELRRELDRLHPGMYTTNVVFTLVALAKLLSNDSSRADEVRAIVNEAVDLKAKIDMEHTGYFSEEVELDILQLSHKNN